MAAIESISQVRQVMEERMLELVLIVRTIDAAVTHSGDGGGPDWHSLFFGRILDLDKAVDAYMEAVHHHAYPVLADLERITR
jgi:hypothetical protein